MGRRHRRRVRELRRMSIEDMVTPEALDRINARFDVIIDEVVLGLPRVGEVDELADHRREQSLGVRVTGLRIERTGTQTCSDIWLSSRSASRRIGMQTRNAARMPRADDPPPPAPQGR